MLLPDAPTGRAIDAGDGPAATTSDLLIVGAGPAGTAAAITARRAGRTVTLIDKAHFPRDKCCGDGLTTSALRTLDDLGLRPDTVPNWNAVTDVVVRDPRGREIRLPLPDNGQYAAVVPRSDLDTAMVALARANGADVREGVTFRGVRSLADRVVVSTDDGDRHEARYVIAADGMWSPVRKALGVGPSDYRGEWHAYRQYFADVGPLAQHLVVWFEPDLLPGYAWSFPLPGQRANVGFGILRGHDHRVADMGALWRDLLDRPHVRSVLGPAAVPEDRPRAWPIPARIAEMPAAHERVLFVGDAVAATDPMTGEGIGQALVTGMHAAAAVTAAGPHRPPVARARYEQALRTHLVRDHRFARSLGNLLRSERTTRFTLAAAGANDWTRRSFARWMFEDYPRAQILTPRRWHRGAMHGPGAFTSLPAATPTEPVHPTVWEQREV